MKSGITVSARGSAWAPPDQAMITIGASAVRPQVSEATDLVTDRIRKLLDAVSRVGIQRSDIQTSNVSISQQTDRDDVPTGFRVRNLVRIRVVDIEKVGDVIAAATSALGESTVLHGLDFERKEISGPETEAREKAWEAIRTKAAQLAALSGVTLGRPVSIVESTGFHPLGPMAFNAAAIDLAFPVEPGQASVQIDLVVRFALAQ